MGDAVEALAGQDLQGKDKADARNATRQVLLAAVGGLVLLTGAGFTARTCFLTRRGQLTDRYTKAIGQLASDKVTERLGGIYALEHLMVESERDHPTVVAVLGAFIREQSRDRPVDSFGEKPGISADLRDAALDDACLSPTLLSDADLTGARLHGADLREAEGLTDAQLHAAHTSCICTAPLRSRVGRRTVYLTAGFAPFGQPDPVIGENGG